MSSQEQAIMDAIIDDLQTHVPEHTLFKYIRPPAIMPDDCPALVVWLDTEMSRPRTTEWFAYDYFVGIAWYVDVTEQGQTLEPDVDKAIDLLDSMQLIKDRIEELSKRGLPGIEGLYEVMPGDVRYAELPRGLNLETGLTQGYSFLVRVSALEA